MMKKLLKILTWGKVGIKVKAQPLRYLNLIKVRLKCNTPQIDPFYQAIVESSITSNKMSPNKTSTRQSPKIEVQSCTENRFKSTPIQNPPRVRSSMSLLWLKPSISRKTISGLIRKLIKVVFHAEILLSIFSPKINRVYMNKIISITCLNQTPTLSRSSLNTLC